MSFISPNEASFQLTMVIEYLESSMSKDLLCKFPDNSAFDFDYTQSSIWSPLLPRPPPHSSARGRELSRKLSYDENSEIGMLENVKTVAARIKRKFSDAVSDNCISRCCKMKRKKRRSFGFSPVGSSRRLSSSSAPSPKVWAKVIKAAAKHFKKRKNKKKDSNVHLDLSSYLTDGNL